MKTALVTQIRRCFPFYEGTRDRANFRGSFEVLELPPRPPARTQAAPKILAFGVDTTIEQHGPHLPLGTDTIQSYAVLHRLASEIDGLMVGPALDYGHLTWGLPFGLSMNLTPPLLSRYMRGFVNAVMAWLAPESLYVADVHGSLAHRDRFRRPASQQLSALVISLGPSPTPCGICRPAQRRARWRRGDWRRDRSTSRPRRFALVAYGIEHLAAGQMPTSDAIELSSNLPQFIARVESRRLNGIVGDIRNAVDPRKLMGRMLNIARQDVKGLVARN